MSNYITFKINKNLFWAGFVAVIIIVLGVISLLLHYFAYLRLAHSTFENYYAFRGCTELLQKTDNYATCKLADGSTIKIVKFNNRWYLNNDLPVCLAKICF